MTIEPALPYSESNANIAAGLWDVSTDEAMNETIIMSYDTPVTATRSIELSSSSVSTYKAKAISLSGIYSDILDPIFLQPIICEASTFLNHFVANQIMDSRIIISKQLTGRYWVETMAYNLTTGLAKMKLIKL